MSKKFTSVSKSLPTETGTYEVEYTPAKSKHVRIGTARYLKSKKSFSSITGVSGRKLSKAPNYRVDTWTKDNRPTSQPKVVAWK